MKVSIDVNKLFCVKVGSSSGSKQVETTTFLFFVDDVTEEQGFKRDSEKDVRMEKDQSSYKFLKNLVTKILDMEPSLVQYLS